MNDKITVCLGKGGQREMAESFARKNNVPKECCTESQTEDFPMKCWYVRSKLRENI